MTTIVSGFIDLCSYDITKRETFRDVNFYLQKGDELMKAPYNKIIFIEKKFEEDIKPFMNENTIFIFFEKEDMKLWELREKILSCSLPTNRHATKDSHDYMIVQCNKTYWMKRAIEINPYNTDNFVWIDFGISYILKKSNIKDLLPAVIDKTYNQVRISGCWKLPQEFVNYNNDNILWFFSGGVFGGDSKSLLEFERLMYDTCVSVINSGVWMWETNIWYFTYYKNPSLFSWYSGAHNEGMFENY